MAKDRRYRAKDFNFEGTAFIVLDYIFTKSVQSELCFYITKKPAHATYSDFFHGCKNDNFQSKSFDCFHIFAQNIDYGFTLEPPQ